jgi:LuxR family maltose regulon positive regulatory protein
MVLRTVLAPDGIGRMLTDAEFVCAVEEAAANTRWLLDGIRAVGTAKLLLGRPDEAVAALREALALTKGEPEFSHLKTICLGFLAFALAETGDWAGARKSAREAAALSAEERLEHTFIGGIAFTARATALVHDGDFDRALAALTSARRTADRFRAMPWQNADKHLRWGDISLDLGDRAAAQADADSARAALHGYPDPGTLPARLEQLDERIRSLSDLDLTPAEIRILPFLPTHLSIEEIGDHLHVARTTVKTHVSSIYKKLEAANRSEAVARMGQLGIQARVGSELHHREQG